MADVTHTSAGYTGTVDQIAEAKRFQTFTGGFRAMGQNDWAVTTVAAQNLTVNIAPGTGGAWGVVDTTTSNATLTVGANGGSTNRYDAIVATYNWAAGTPNTTFRVVPGTTAPPPVNTGTTVVSTALNRVRGVQYDATLAIIQVRPGVGALATTDVFDSRLWGGYGGSLMIATTAYLGSVDAIAGTEVYSLQTHYRWRFDGSNWGWPSSAQGQLARADFVDTVAATPLAATSTGLPAFNVTVPEIPTGRRIRVSFSAMLSTNTSDTTYAFILNFLAVDRRGSITLSSTSNNQRLYFASVFESTQRWVNPGGSVSGGRIGGTGTSYMNTTGFDGPAQFLIEDIGSI